MKWRVIKLTLKFRGNKRARKDVVIECPTCQYKIIITEENTEHIEGIRYVICDQCGSDVILRK